MLMLSISKSDQELLVYYWRLLSFAANQEINSIWNKIRPHEMVTWSDAFALNHHYSIYKLQLEASLNLERKCDVTIHQQVAKTNWFTEVGYNQWLWFWKRYPGRGNAGKATWLASTLVAVRSTTTDSETAPWPRDYQPWCRY